MNGVNYRYIEICTYSITNNKIQSHLKKKGGEKSKTFSMYTQDSI